MRKILVLRGGALGDFLVTLPALALLRQRWPDARIELAGNATAAALALRADESRTARRPSLQFRAGGPASARAGLLDAVHSQHEARWSALFSAAPLPGEFAAWLADFDLVVNFWPDPEGELRARFPFHARQVFLHGDAQPTLAPAAAHFCAPLQSLGLTTGNFFFPLRARESEARLIAIHPGSGSPKKNWPVDRWAALCEWLRDAHAAEILVVTGEAESTAARALAHFGTAAHELALDQLVARLAACRLFIGHDSGISHLAAACGVPGILLFGPTEPAMWAPPAPEIRVVSRGPDVSAITLADVQRIIVIN